MHHLWYSYVFILWYAKRFLINFLFAGVVIVGLGSFWTSAFGMIPWRFSDTE